MNKTSPVFETLIAQPRVKKYLTSVTQGGSLSHAYLFIAPPGSLKGEASTALAAAALCESGTGCGTCDSCIRVGHKTHPDVHYVSPEGATYVVDQIREVARDSALAPIRGSRKIYILERVDLLGESAASALLKTLEEPPANVIFVLQARSESAILPTIISRCQVVPFRRTPPGEALTVLVGETGATPEEAKAALAAAGGVLKNARELLLSPSAWSRRSEILSICSHVETMDDLDILEAAKKLIGFTKSGTDELKVSQEEQQQAQSDFLSREALKKLEQQHKREISFQERQSLSQVFDIFMAYYRDSVLLEAGLGANAVNYDVVSRPAHCQGVNESERCVKIDAAIQGARERVPYNVNPQLIVERMLFDIKEAILCPM